MGMGYITTQGSSSGQGEESADGGGNLKTCLNLQCSLLGLRPKQNTHRATHSLDAYINIVFNSLDIHKFYFFTVIGIQVMDDGKLEVISDATVPPHRVKMLARNITIALFERGVTPENQ